jgi:predicted P-loop ATPase
LAREFDVANKIIHLPVSTTQDADEHARKDTKRNRRLFDWADAVLKRLGLDKAVAAAKSIEELGRVALDTDSAEVTLVIRDALHPASGKPQDHFRGLTAAGLKVVLKNRLGELKKARREALRRGKQPDWSDRLMLDEEGKIIGNLANLILILRESPDWKGVLRFDEFATRVVIKRRPPFEAAINTPWTDHDESQARVWFLRQGIKAAAGDVGRAVQAAARHNAFNPVRDFFESLVWDGVPRLEAWLQDYLHVEDSEYARAIGPRYLISAVARVYQPGAKVDHMLVLEGPQGRLKSEALRTLAIKDEWFTDRLSHIATKDAALDVAGVLIVEIAEMDALTRATPSAMKLFLTRRRDRYRPPYGKHMVDRPRQNVFAGTINPVGGYLRDPSGARRFWPVACRGMIDRDGLEKVRDQLWAEAVHRYKAGAKWWLETPQLEALATAEQDARFAVDAWEEAVRKWIGDRTDVGLAEILENVLGLAPEHQSQAAQRRVVAILTHLGFEKRRPRTASGGREHRYQRDPVKK